MPDQHPSRSKLELFMRGELTAADCRELVLHLLSGCDECREVARQSFPCESAGQVEESNRTGQRSSRSTTGYRGIFEQVLPKIWESEVTAIDERASAPALFEELQRHPHERRLLMVRNSRKFRSIALCELVLEEAFRYGFSRPADAVDSANLGVILVDLLDETRYGGGLIGDFRARGYSVLANALRISGDLHGAAREFARAQKHLDEGTGDPLERARFLELFSYLANEHRDFRTALARLDAAIKIYRSQGEAHRLGRALIVKGHHEAEKGDLGLAVASLRQGLRLIEEQREPRLVLVAKHNLVRLLYLSGRYHQATALLPEVRALHSELGSELDVARFHWLEGQIARESGELVKAEETLSAVRRIFVERRIPHDAALVSLDLAVIFLRQNRTSDLKTLAAEMLSLFRSLRIPREAIAALVLFQKAVEIERVTFGLVRDLAAYLRNSSNDPHLPFRPTIDS